MGSQIPDLADFVVSAATARAALTALSPQPDGTRWRDGWGWGLGCPAVTQRRPWIRFEPYQPCSEWEARPGCLWTKCHLIFGFPIWRSLVFWMLLAPLFFSIYDLCAWRPPPIPLWQEFAGSPAIERFLGPMAGHHRKVVLICNCQRSHYAMKRCAQCHGKLGLGVRFRNFWNGDGWHHLRFCSSYCQTLYELVRRGQKATTRWHDFLSQRNP
jgi:hypothetical protein